MNTVRLDIVIRGGGKIIVENNEFVKYDLKTVGNFYGLITMRVILGLVQAPVFPALGAFVVPWYPAEERGRLCSIGYIGISVKAI